MFALLCSRQRMNFESPERPDSVLNLLKEIGLNQTQISRIVRTYPQFLLYDPEKTLLPKIEFFRSVGVSSSDLPGILSSNPMLLARSLEKHLIPCYDFLKSVLLVDEKVLKALKRSPRVMDMGFNPSKMVFAVAIRVLLKMSKTRFESKFELYKRWGWSKDMALSAFKRYPISLSFSLEKRIMPRFSVIQILVAKDLVKNDLSLSTILSPNESSFLEKFVIKFQDDIPQLLSVYEGKKDLLEVGSRSENVCVAEQL
ncbi:hypothetical protein SLA2020_270160 [Shorea laevis]